MEMVPVRQLTEEVSIYSTRMRMILWIFSQYCFKFQRQIELRYDAAYVQSNVSKIVSKRLCMLPTPWAIIL